MTELQEKVLQCIKSMVDEDIPATKENIIDYSGGSYTKHQLSPVLSKLEDLGYLESYEVAGESCYKLLDVVADVSKAVEEVKKEQVRKVAIILRDRYMGYKKGAIIPEPFPRGLENGVHQHMVKIIEENE